MYGTGSCYGSSCGASYGSAAYGASNASYGSSYAGASQSYFPAEQLYAHSSLDNIVSHASVEKPVERFGERIAVPGYVPGSAKGAYLAGNTPHGYFIADTFLRPGSTARFIGDAAEIKEFVEEAFKATTGDELPADIQITVLQDNEFRKAHKIRNGTWNDSVQGFSLNTNGRGVNKVFVRANALDRLMLTAGHEIGHVLTPSLSNLHDEEAKAFAFSLAWMNAIREKNIAGIGANILPQPAENGLHDQAFAFVQKLVKDGLAAWDVFLQLARGEANIREQPITVEV